MRVSGYEIPDKKKLLISLRTIFGIGKTRASIILKHLNVSEDFKTKDLTSDMIVQIENFINQNYKVGSELQSANYAILRAHAAINLIRAKRKRLGLPRHGRTKSNAKTTRRLRKGGI